MSTPVAAADEADGSRRTAILRAAYRVMARDGARSTPLARVAEEAGVSKGLLLYHFERKDALILAAFEWALDATAARIRSRLAAPDEPAGAIDVIVDAVWVGPEANRDFFRFYLDGVDHFTRSPEFAGLGATSRSIIDGLYRDVLVAATDAGAIEKVDPDAAATMMRAVIEGFFLQWLQTDDWRAAHSSYREECRAALKALLG